MRWSTQIRVYHYKGSLGEGCIYLSKSCKEPIVEQIFRFEVVEGITDEKVKGCDVSITSVFVEELDDEKMTKNVVSEVEKEIISLNGDCDDAEGTVKQAHKKKMAKKRKTKKRKMAPPRLGGASHYSPPLNDLDSTLLTSSTTT